MPGSASGAARLRALFRRMSGGRPLVAGVVLVAMALLLRPLFSGSPGPPDLEPASAPSAPALETVFDTLGRGQTLAELMAKQGLTPLDVHAISQAIREHKMPRTVRPGVVLRFGRLPGEAPGRLRLELNADSLLHVVRSDSGWTTRIQAVPVIVDTVRLAGRIESSLWFAELSGEVHRLADGEFEEFVFNLADVFAWKVDFTRDIRKGDAFRVVMEREVRPDGSVRSRRFLAIELRNRGRVLSAIPFTRPDGRREYFSEEGESLRGVFLRYPVPYRITSGFTLRRYHPILKRNRPHQGIDYGAPRGARVQATAAGTVTRAGWWGAYGRAIEIRHRGGIRTRYAHLSSISSGVRVGAFVDQGDVIGRVGSTGLATGAHLHYEFIRNGRHRNPLTVELPSSPGLEKEHMPAFAVKRDSVLGLLAAVALPTGHVRHFAGASETDGTTDAEE